MSKLHGEVLILPKVSGSVSTPKSLSGNVGAKTINIGGKGEDGATFIPFVSSDGIISWTNDKGLPNPEPVNIKGKDGVNGKDGYTPVKGIDYFDGKDGAPGKDGQPGEDGADGVSPVVAVEKIDGGHRVTITDKDGEKTFDVMDGEDGAVTEEQIASAVEDYMAEHPVEVTDIVKTVNGISPDENGNVEIPVSGGNVDLTGYATEQYVKDYAQPKGNYLTEVPSGYATEEFVKNKIAEAELGGEEVDLSGYAQKSELPTKVSQLQNDSGYLTAVPDGYAKTEDIPKNASDIGAQPEGDYALRSEIPSVPVKSVNGKTGTVSLTATDVKARPDSWMPSASDVGALPSSTVIPTVPTKLSAFANDSGFITGYTETDPTVPSWAKQANKPSYTASEVGALPNTTKIPSKTSDLTNDSGYITGYTETDPTVPAWAKAASKPSYSKSEVGLGNVDNVKQYSASNPPPYPVTSVNGKTGAVTITVPTVPTKVSAFENDKGYLTQHQDISGKLDTSALPTAINTALEQAKASGEFDGEDGYTPVKGKDYYTEADTAEFSAYIASELAKRGQLAPEYANNIEECTDTTKLYVLPDGMIYAYILTEVEAGPSYKNWLTYSVNKDGSDYRGDNGEDGYRKGYRYSSSSAAEKAATGYDCIGWIPVNANDVVRIANVGDINENTDSNMYATAYHLNRDFGAAGGATYLGNQNNQMISIKNGVYTYAVPNNTAIKWVKLTLMGVTDNTIITINEEITEGGGTTITYAWASTGHAFVPADYEDRIVAVENTTAQHTAKITALEKAVKNGGADASETAAYSRIKNWKYPINEDAPVFLLESDKPAIATSEQNTDAVYAKYDALMNANPGFVSKVNCGMASDGTTPIYVYHFKEAEPHYSGPNWSETKPVILVCSGVHPTEQTGVHSLYYAMEEITTNPKLLDLRRNVHFIVMPMINPTGFTDTTYGVRNPDGIQVHYNFEVDFTYPTDPYYVAHGNRNHGGETPLSIPETQYFDALMDEYKDNLAIVVSCHNNDIDEQYGTGFIWCSCATHFMCNLGFRFADKMSAAWREKHGTAFDEGVRWANEYALAQAAAGSSLFNSTYVKEQPEWDYRVGRASISGSGGTEYKQALKYGVHGVNVETCDRCMVLDKDFSKKRTANVTTMGCETYVNFFRTFMAAYDPKDKKDYAPNLPWEN